MLSIRNSFTCNDQYALINLLQYWSKNAALLLGWPTRFWRRATTDPTHPFFGHPVLSHHGGLLASAARRRGLERCKEKGFWPLRHFFPFQTLNVIGRLRSKEAGHDQELIQLAKRAVTMAKELVKGTVELICLHGLNRLTDDTYRQVISAADGVDFEPWMLQTGGELWRRLLAVLPSGRPVAELLMQMARMPARSLETLMLAIVEQPPRAREILAALGESEA
jgi:hypothetical protein